MDNVFATPESVLVREFAAAVMTLGFDSHIARAVRTCYEAACADDASSDAAAGTGTAFGATEFARCHASTSEQAYWVERSLAWFEATVRSDVNGGVNTRALILQRDPRLAHVLAHVYGDGDWRFHDSSPGPLQLPLLSGACPLRAELQCV